MTQAQASVSETSPLFRELAEPPVASQKSKEQQLFDEFSRLLDKIAVQLQHIEGTADFEIAVESVVKKVKEVKKQNPDSPDLSSEDLPKDIHDLARQLVESIPEEEESELKPEYDILRKIAQVVEEEGESGEIEELSLEEVTEEIEKVISEDGEVAVDQPEVTPTVNAAPIEADVQVRQDVEQTSENLEYFEVDTSDKGNQTKANLEKSTVVEPTIEEAPVEQSATENLTESELLKAQLAKLVATQNQQAPKEDGGDKESVLARFLESVLGSGSTGETLLDQANPQVTRDSVMASIMMRQILGNSATSLTDTSSAANATAIQQEVNTIVPTTQTESSGSKGTKSERAGLLTRSQESRTLERVQNALKEIAKSKDGSSISVRLDPPSLGTVRIDLSLRDGALYARLVAESPQVNNLLREKSGELQKTLRMLGLNVDQVNVTIGEGQEQFAGSGFSQESGRDLGSRTDESTSGVVMGDGPRITGERKVVAQPTDHWVA